MTVINMMSFGNSGAAIADEQSSSGGRKYNVANKLQILNGNIIYGCSGPSDLIKEIYDTISAGIDKCKEKELVTYDKVYDLARSIATHLKNLKKGGYLLDNYGISLDDAHAGTKEDSGRKLDDAVKSKVLETLTDSRFNSMFSTNILLGAVADGKFEISYIDNDGFKFKKVPRPYGSIGSGSDESDKVLARYVAGLLREKRESIPVVEGLVKLIEATNSSANMNLGVGGSPSIVYINSEGKIRIPGESQCLLASEVVEGYTQGFLQKDFTYDAVNKLVIANSDFKALEGELKKQAGTNWDIFCRRLRGYKE
jgi:hypothetical protein